MGVRLELHAVKEENVKRIVVALRTHGSREEAVLYQSADELAPDMGEALASKLSAYRARHQPGSARVGPTEPPRGRRLKSPTFPPMERV